MTMLPRVRATLARLPHHAFGALAGQVTLALGNFVLAVVATRELGPTGFGTYALLFGAIVMATAVTSGLLGDSLTVLDRRNPAIRASLFRIGGVLVTVLATAGFGLSQTVLAPTTAVLFALALAAFVLADLGRRLLMANLRFWSLVLIDSAGLVALLAFLAGFAQLGTLTLDHFLAALAIGQIVAGLLALTRLPDEERKVRLRGPGDWRAVLGYGSWRALQQFVRPTTLNLARSVVLVTAGAAAVGELEAARVFVAPAMLFVQGVGSYLFATYAADRAKGPRVLLARADRAAMVMLAGAVLVGGAAWIFLPHLGSLVTAGAFQLSGIAILGWACYAASCAAVLPYGSLAAVQGKQQWVLLIRVVDSVLALALVVLVLTGLDVGPEWMPWLLSIGSFAGGALCRQLLLRPRRTVATEPAEVAA